MKCVSKIIFSFLAVLTVFFPLAVLAVTVTDITDQVSSSQISVGSNHKFIITLSDDIAESETVQLTFPAGFTLSSITEDDIDIADDGVDLSTATDCSGADAASVSISGQTILIAICAGDGGAIASGSIVTIEVGANAAFSGLGTNRITNPSAVASWFVNFLGTSGNSGSVVLITTTTGSVSVSATVPAPVTPPADSGGGGAGDTPPSTPPAETPPEVPPETTPPPDAVPPSDTTPPDETPSTPSSDSTPSSGSSSAGSGSGSSSSSSSGSGGGGSTHGSTVSDATAPSSTTEESSGIVDVPLTEEEEMLPEASPTTAEPAATSSAPTKSTTTTKAIAKVQETVDSVQTAVASVIAAIEGIRALPEVRQAVSIAIPVASVAVAATTAVLVSSFNLLSYLQFLFTAPFLLFARRKRKAFGIVYNSVTKVAVELATVRLYDAVTNRLIRSAVTDTSGKYFFIANPGQYRLAVIKNNWTFPSTYLGNVKDDGVYFDVYTGQIIEVTEKDATIAANIPLDYLEDTAKHTKQGMVNRRILRKLQFGFSISGVFLSAAIWFFSPSVLTLLLAIGQVIAFLFCLRLARAKRSRGWGVVYDASSRRPVGNAVVRLFEPKYNKLVESTLTDTLGRYSFLVGPNEYFVRTDKPGYDEHVVRPIDYRQKTEPSAIAIDVPLTPTKPV